MTRWMTRARLKRDASIAALAPMLLPVEAGARAGAAHRLVWSLFADDSDAPRDFLWRDIGDGAFMALSVREPASDHPLLEVASKPFAPVLTVGDRLTFDLHVNPTVDRRSGRDTRQRADVVMDAIHALPKGARAEARDAAVTTATRDWFATRAGEGGYDPDTLKIEPRGYRVQRIPRTGPDGRVQGPIHLGIVDLTGALTVTDPDAFTARLAKGFGRAKAFGCGLMLIRRG